MSILKIIILAAITMLLPLGISAQSRWSNIYFPDDDAIGLNINLSYDNGFLMVGKHGHNYVNYNWVIKTNVNGDILWKKTIGVPTTNIAIEEMCYNAQGDLYMAGLTGYYNQESYDPLIMKLNPCGEKEWCRVFLAEGINHVSALEVTEVGDVVVVLIQMSTIPFTDDICMAKFDTNGNLLWKYCYNSSDNALFDSNALDLTLTPDDGFLITGYCSYEDPNPPHLWWWKPYYIKTDSMGVFEWEQVVHNEVSDVGGDGLSTVLNPDKTYYYSSIYHNYYSEGGAAALLKMDLTGNIIGIYDLVNPGNEGTLFEAKFITDSTLIASALLDTGAPKAVIIDTLGTILLQTNLLENDWMANTEVTHDGKLLFFTNQHDNNGNFDAYLFKLNQQLQSDTIYNQVFTYDSLCPYPILSDTITQEDCEVIVSNKYLDLSPNATGQLFIYPNPAKDSFIIRINEAGRKVKTIEIIDMYGQTVKSLASYQSESGIIVDSESLENGIYIVKVFFSDGSQASGKVIVSK